MITRTHQAFTLALLLLSLPPVIGAQVVVEYPWRESFDTSRVPLLPAAWSTSKAKSPAGDFTTTQSTPCSPPASALSTDARVAQQLLSPVLSLAGKKAETLEFFERRSASFNAGLLVEAALDEEDTLAWLPLCDTLTLVSSSAYLRRTITLPAALDNRAWLRLRWRTLGNGTGATGTLRIDDVTLTVEREVDLALDSAVSVSPRPIGPGADAACTFTVRNLAREGSYRLSLALYDSDSSASVVAQATLTHAFAVDESVPVTLTYPAVAPGLHRMRCVLSCADDEDTTNNETRFELSAAFPPGAVVVNEIMYEPAEGEAEYLELFNPSDKSVNLQGWTIADKAASQKNRTVIALSSSGAHMIAPHAYVIVADDSSIIDFIRRTAEPGSACDAIIRSSLSLNNSGDEIYLLDASGAEIEHLSYAPSWHIPRVPTVGRSLERINPSLAAAERRNWSSSIAAQGGTPGARNSIYTVSLPSAAALELSPNPFSPNGDGIEDFCSITYALPSTVVRLRVRIYDSAGRLVRTLANNEPGASGGAIIWDGRDDRAMRVRMGVYIIFLEALDAQGGVLRALKASAVVATRL